MDYPPTPSFGMVPGQAQQATEYYESPHVAPIEYDSRIQDERRVLEYNLAHNNAVFRQNATIPGFSAAAMASGIPPLPIYDSMELNSHSYAPLEPSLQRVRQISTNQSRSPVSSDNLTPRQYSQKMLPDPSHKYTAQPTEEGEVSEGEFEDKSIQLQESDKSTAYGRPKKYDAYDSGRQLSTSQPMYIANKAHGYSSTQPTTDAYGRSLDLVRQRSESYSPRLAGLEAEYSSHAVANVASHEPHPDYNDQYEPRLDLGSVEARTQEQNQYKNLSQSKLYATRIDETHSDFRGIRNTTFSVDAPNPSNFNHTNYTFKSLHDARKEAQNAILNLLPLKVRLQNYVDEGIDEEVVRRQFAAIGLPQGPLFPHTHPLESIHSTFSSLKQSQSSTGALSQPAHDHLAESASLGGSVTKHSPISTKPGVINGEERKDRIARLLAEKTQKLLSNSASVDPVSNTTLPESTVSNKTTTSQAAAKADKERLLRLKMEALQKSREQRAQKAASKLTSSLLTSMVEEANPKDSIMMLQETVSPISQVTAQLPKNSSPDLPAGQLSSGIPQATPSKLAKTVPSIPGLFLSASTNTPSPAPSPKASNTPLQGINLRKRPVASDFDTLSTTVAPYKRPFGQNRNDQPLVIDVSEDESDDGGLDDILVEHQGLDNMAFSAFGNGAISARPSMRDLPPLSDFPARRPFPTVSSAVNTPPIAQSQTKVVASKPEDLQRKEKEIQEMKRKIAEAEKRKRAKQASSGSQTPLINEGPSSPVKPVAEVNISETVEASIQIERLIDDTNRQVNEDQQKLADVLGVEQAKSDELKVAEADRRRLRRAKIASDLPAVDAEVEKSQKRLADLRAEMAQLEAAVQQGLTQKQMLAEEMDRLGQEAEEQLQAQKEKLSDLRREEESGVEATSLHSESVDLPDSTTKESIPPLKEGAIDTIAREVQLTPIPEAPQSQILVQNNSDIFADHSSGNGGQSGDPDIAMNDISSSSEIFRESKPGSGHNHAALNRTPDRTLEAALQNTSTQVDAETSNQVSRDRTIETSYAPDPAELAPASPDSRITTSQLNEMLPAASTGNVADTFDNGSDQYEPPEATPSPMDISPHPGSPHFSPAPPGLNLATNETDVQPTNSLDTVSVDSGPKNEHTFDNTKLPPQRIEGTEIGRQGSDLENVFTPYESPLKRFRAYRFHPSFQKDISGGFKSLTYSNSIIADQELCRYELAGGVCNDPTCEFQHFRSMGLPDDAILVELGNSAGYTEEEKPRFVAGLRTVLQELRAKKTKDFQTIASEIAAYRTRFLGDDSRVLLLDGVTL